MKASGSACSVGRIGDDEYSGWRTKEKAWGEGEGGGKAKWYGWGRWKDGDGGVEMELMTKVVSGGPRKMHGVKVMVEGSHNGVDWLVGNGEDGKDGDGGVEMGPWQIGVDRGGDVELMTKVVSGGSRRRYGVKVMVEGRHNGVPWLVGNGEDGKDGDGGVVEPWQMMTKVVSGGPRRRHGVKVMVEGRHNGVAWLV